MQQLQNNQIQPSCRIFEYPNTIGGNNFVIYVDELDDYDYYINAIEKITNASPNDNIVLKINSPGGYLNILNAFLTAIEFSQANSIVAEIIGEACSAAAILALACDDIYVGYNAVMLIHTIRSGHYGKVEDVRNHLEITKVQQNRIVKKYYSGFLTDDEIDDVLLGKELWLTADEIIERWNIKKELKQKEIEKIQEEYDKLLVKFFEGKGYEITKVLDKK